MSSVNFSFNEIDGFEGEEDGTFKGVNANTIALGGNKLKNSRIYYSKQILKCLF